jgi:nucleoid DNA-binding protein
VASPIRSIPVGFQKVLFRAKSCNFRSFGILQLAARLERRSWNPR